MMVKKAVKKKEKNQRKKKDVEESEENKNSKYLEFWKEFGKSIKLGVLEDQKKSKTFIRIVTFSKQYIFKNTNFIESIY